MAGLPRLSLPPSHASWRCVGEGLTPGALPFQKEELELGEPIHHLIHRIMSTSSYNQEDLGLSARYVAAEQQGGQGRASGEGPGGM